MLSHRVLDFVTHRPDLPLWPGGPLAGLGLGNSVPGTIVVEGGSFAAGTWAYLRAWGALMLSLWPPSARWFDRHRTPHATA